MMASPISRTVLVVRGHRQLPLQVLGERVLGGERVLDRRQFLDLDRGAVAARAVVEVVPEEVGVVLVVPALGTGGRLGGLAGAVLALGLGDLVVGADVVRGRLFEHRILNHFLVEHLGELERRHRQQLDGLLQRWRQNELLNEFGVQPLLDCHSPDARTAPRAIRRLYPNPI